MYPQLLGVEVTFEREIWMDILKMSLHTQCGNKTLYSVFFFKEKKGKNMPVLSSEKRNRRWEIKQEF